MKLTRLVLLAGAAISLASAASFPNPDENPQLLGVEPEDMDAGIAVYASLHDGDDIDTDVEIGFDDDNMAATPTAPNHVVLEARKTKATKAPKAPELCKCYWGCGRRKLGKRYCLDPPAHGRPKNRKRGDKAGVAAKTTSMTSTNPKAKPTFTKTTITGY